MTGNKAILEIRLIGEAKLEITFLHWDKRFLADYKEDKEMGKDIQFVYFESEDKEFSMYSHEDGYIIEDGQYAIAVPDINYMKPGFVMEYEFRNDRKRYGFLKHLYRYLPEWASRWETFEKDGKKNYELIVNDQYWIC